MHCSDVIAIYKKYICLIASRDIKLLILKCINLLYEKRERVLLFFIIYSLYNNYKKKFSLYSLY